MKAAGILALVLAVLLGVAAALDFSQNYRQEQVFADHSELEGSSAVAREDRSIADKMLLGERFDALLGIAAAFALVAGVALIGKSKSSYPVAHS